MLIKDIYDNCDKKEPNNNNLKQNIIYLYLKDLNKFILDNNIDNFTETLSDLKEYIVIKEIKEFYFLNFQKGLKEDYITDNFKNIVIEPSIKIINQNENFFKTILRFYRDTNMHNSIIQNNQKYFYINILLIVFNH